jgi:hypothetical protein
MGSHGMRGRANTTPTVEMLQGFCKDFEAAIKKVKVFELVFRTDAGNYIKAQLRVAPNKVCLAEVRNRYKSRPNDSK